MRFRKCVDEREVKICQKNHFAIRNEERKQKRSKSVQISRKNLTKKNMEQLLYVLAQNKNNRLEQVDEKKGLGFFQALCKKNPHIMYDRFSKKLVKFLKLNLKKKLTGYHTAEDLVIRVRDTFQSKSLAENLMVIGMS